MRLCYNDITTSNENSIAASATVHAEFLKNNFSPEKMYSEFIEAMSVEQEFNVEQWIDNLDIEEIE